MTDPVVAQASPFEVEVVSGKKYAWCACGLSSTQPFCDGSHKGTGLVPLVAAALEEGTVWYCGCKHTKTPPFCDGSHNSL